MSLQFKPLDALQSVHLGLLWSLFRSQGFTAVEDHGELEPEFEDLEIGRVQRVGVKFRTFDDAPPLPRVWFLNESKTELIQVQRDRLIVNWRQGATPEPYPRYESVMLRFQSALKLFRDFLKAENLGGVDPNQCELTYVNHIPAGEGWESHGEAGLIVAPWKESYSDSYLPTPEDVLFRLRFRMTDDLGNLQGRLHVNLQPAFRTIDTHPIYVLTLTGRGRPQPQDLEGSLQLFDREHEWIVRGFTSITTAHMHQIWGRKI